MGNLIRWIKLRLAIPQYKGALHTLSRSSPHPQFHGLRGYVVYRCCLGIQRRSLCSTLDSIGIDCWLRIAIRVLPLQDKLFVYIYRGSSRYRSFLHQLICHANFVGVPLSLEAMPVKLSL